MVPYVNEQIALMPYTVAHNVKLKLLLNYCLCAHEDKRWYLKCHATRQFYLYCHENNLFVNLNAFMLPDVFIDRLQKKVGSNKNSSYYNSAKIQHNLKSKLQG